MKLYYKNYVNRIGIFEGKMLHKVGLVLDAGLVRPSSSGYTTFKLLFVALTFERK